MNKREGPICECGFDPADDTTTGLCDGRCNHVDKTQREAVAQIHWTTLNYSHEDRIDALLHWHEAQTRAQAERITTLEARLKSISQYHHKCMHDGEWETCIAGTCQQARALLAPGPTCDCGGFAGSYHDPQCPMRQPVEKFPPIGWRGLGVSDGVNHGED